MRTLYNMAPSPHREGSQPMVILIIECLVVALTSGISNDSRSGVGRLPGVVNRNSWSSFSDLGRKQLEGLEFNGGDGTSFLHEQSCLELRAQYLPII